MTRCPNCGAEVARGAAFCGSCGERIPASGGGPRRWLVPALAAVLAAVAVVVFVVLGSEDEARGETIRFQEVEEPGEDPFTAPADRAGRDRVPVRAGGSGAGPFGGSGSNRVCDRELLIRSLARSPERMREFARVLGVEPNQKAVAAYIRKLRPVTLTRDTRVTNHTFEDGRAAPIQDILQAGTAVLADARGNPVVRCRCGNPLRAPRAVSQDARCEGCPAGYDIARACTAGARCQRRYPNPPPVRQTGGDCTTRVGPAQFSPRPQTVDVDVGSGVSCAEAIRIVEQFYAAGQLWVEVEGWGCGVPGSGRAGILVSCGRPGDDPAVDGIVARRVR